MKLKCILCVALAGLLAASLALVSNAEDKEVTIKGTIVDMACYLEKGKVSGDHATCAKACVKGGTAAGLLAEDGQIYLIVPHGKEGKSPLEHVGSVVEATGVVHERFGLKGLTAKSCKKVEDGKDAQGEQTDSKEEITVKGEVVDLACWLEDGKMGAEHSKCAKSCVSGGTPAGIVTDDGAVYVWIVHGKDGKAPGEYVAQKYEFKGTVHDRNGVKGVIVKSAKKLEEPKKNEGSEGSHK